MEDLQHLKVVQHNDLVRAVAKMDKIPLKFFELAVSCIDVENPPNDNTVLISKEALYSFFKAESASRKGRYRFRKYIVEMMKQSIFLVNYKNGKRIEQKVISSIESVEFEEDSDIVCVTFTNRVMPFLVDLKESFTQYNVVNLVDMKSRYSVVIYKWLVMNFNQYKKYENVKHKNPTISLEELRELTDTKDKYKDFRNFEKSVLSCVDEISQVSNLNVTYEKIRSGRYINAIQFFVTEKPIKTVAPLDEAYLQKRETKEEREKRLEASIAKAVTSDYFIKLNEYHVITGAVFTNREALASLYDNLFPIYSEIEKEFGYSEVERHIKYMQNQLSTRSESREDIGALPKYLTRAAENYLNRLRSEQTPF
ncbi:replication initiation protein [Enterococcus faecalis]|uniref:replication initiation protein n=1 Tax=Enterococcus faecalis TaxID=1351 RepID=UPI0025B05A41|nr:replication initiation protein [Enterococcus faecalis]MDN3202202.1 replication initiation protein [Enterococcus faecalis]